MVKAWAGMVPFWGSYKVVVTKKIKSDGHQGCSGDQEDVFRITEIRVQQTLACPMTAISNVVIAPPGAPSAPLGRTSLPIHPCTRNKVRTRYLTALREGYAFLVAAS